MTDQQLNAQLTSRPRGHSILSLICRSLLVVAAITLPSGEAAAATILQIEHKPIEVERPMADLENRIKKAGARRGWKMKNVGTGQLEATIHVRTHMAKVTITFDQETYSIRYLGSDNLKHNVKKQKIHGAYNKWVTNLKNDINVELTY